MYIILLLFDYELQEKWSFIISSRVKAFNFIYFYISVKTEPCFISKNESIAFFDFQKLLISLT